MTTPRHAQRQTLHPLPSVGGTQRMPHYQNGRALRIRSPAPRGPEDGGVIAGGVFNFRRGFEIQDPQGW